MLPIQITIRDMPPSPALNALIRKNIKKLHKIYQRIIRCHVVVEFAQKNQHQGKVFNVRIDVTVPGKEFASTNKRNESAHIAIRESFQAMKRQLEEHVRKRNGKQKNHNSIMYGYVTRIMAKDGYGFIEGKDGNEYYFSLTNVSHPSFEQLNVGDAVEYSPEILDDGRQAHHIVREKNNQRNSTEMIMQAEKLTS